MTLHRTLLLIVTLFAGNQTCADDAGIEFFEKRIRPVLIRHCYECHSAASSEPKGGLRLDSRDFIRKGGESGPAVVPGNTTKSLLLNAVRHESFEMPPDRKLPNKVIKDFETWIEAGAGDPRDKPPTAEEVANLSWRTIFEERRNWWSLQPVDPDVAKVARTFGQNSARVSLQIDAFISARQQAAKIKPAEPATVRVLARRLSFVLTGLPPDPAEVNHFANAFVDNPVAAYEAYVDRRLDSPHFGEHWARHWLDVVRFAETHGYEWNHEIRDAWRYRDYLIRAFNSDLPYDQLVREHIAGDLLKSPRINKELGINESLIGTAFWRFGELGHDDCVTFPEIRFDALDNQIDTFAKAFQGLTVSCTRCHDHKLDAISTKDYYALVGILENCSQVVHTLDSHDRIADAADEIRRVKVELRQLLADRWLAAVKPMKDTIVETLSGETGLLAQGAKARPLGRENPGYVLSQFVKASDSQAGERFVLAKWIWDKPNAFQNEPSSAPIYFRFEFNLEESPEKAELFATADDRVTSYLNGKHLGVNQSWNTPARYGVQKQLTNGRNVIAFEAANGVGPAGFIASLVIDGKELGSSSQWKVTRKLEDNWTRLEFDDSKWSAASEMGPSTMSPWRISKESKRKDGSLAGNIPASWKNLADEFRTEHERRERAFAANREVWADFRSKPKSDWSISGLGLAGGPNRAGEFTLAEDGDQIVTAILPAGIHTNILSNRLNGSIRSPWLPAEKKFISVQVVGDRRSMVRTVVDSCGLNEFAGGGLTYLNGGQTTWRTFPTSAAPGLRSFVELTTRSDNPRWPDRPGRAGSADPKVVYDYRSSFGIIQAVLHDTPGAPAPNLEHMLVLFDDTSPDDPSGIAAAFQDVARKVITAWKEERATDRDVRWLNWFLQHGLLPNTSGKDQQRLQKLMNRYRAAASSIPEPRVIAGLADQGSSRGFPVLAGGDPKKPGAVMPTRYLEVLSGAAAFETTGSGRLELAEQITSPDNPLTARVMVNRLWHHLFGRGIVATTDDFGRMGEKPTHPQLLDFLADQFIKDGWSVKRLIRHIVLSRTFQQTSAPARQAEQIDPGNQLLHHFPARRLDAESIRDTILAVSGRLTPDVFGRSLHPHRAKEIDYRKLFSGPLDSNGRRSIYIKVTRMEGPQFLELFDFPDRMVTRGKRDRTNVPAQALAMLNGPFVIDQARFWAEQLVAAEHGSIEARVREMFEHAVGRSPSAVETERFVSLIKAFSDDPDASEATLLDDKGVWEDAAHAIFNMKETIHIR